jgi:hypothetical protein
MTGDYGECQMGRGVEFIATIAPQPGSGVLAYDSPWYGEITLGVTVNPQGYAALSVTITKKYAGAVMIEHLDWNFFKTDLIPHAVLKSRGHLYVPARENG